MLKNINNNIHILLLVLFILATSPLLSQIVPQIDRKGLNGKPLDAGIYKDLQAVFANKATRKGQFGVVENMDLIEGRPYSKVVEGDSASLKFFDISDTYYAFCDGEYLFLNHEEQLCLVCVIGTYMVFLSYESTLFRLGRSDVYWLMDTRTGKKHDLFSAQGLRALLNAYPEIKAEFKEEEFYDDETQSLNKYLKYVRQINEHLTHK